LLMLNKFVFFESHHTWNRGSNPTMDCCSSVVCLIFSFCLQSS
jgi:hypothetical protein